MRYLILLFPLSFFSQFVLPIEDTGYFYLNDSKRSIYIYQGNDSMQVISEIGQEGIIEKALLIETWNGSELIIKKRSLKEYPYISARGYSPETRKIGYSYTYREGALSKSSHDKHQLEIYKLNALSNSDPFSWEKESKLDPSVIVKDTIHFKRIDKTVYDSVLNLTYIKEYSPQSWKPKLFAVNMVNENMLVRQLNMYADAYTIYDFIEHTSKTFPRFRFLDVLDGRIMIRTQTQNDLVFYSLMMQTIHENCSIVKRYIDPTMVQFIFTDLDNNSTVTYDFKCRDKFIENRGGFTNLNIKYKDGKNERWNQLKLYYHYSLP